MIGRLVSATNVVRKAPLVIEADRSKQSYGEQLRALVDTRIELSLIRHEQESIALFARRPAITGSLRQMKNYLGDLTGDPDEP